MALSTLTGTITAGGQWTAQKNLTGSAYNPNVNASSIAKSYNLGTANANNAAGGADELFSFQQAIAASGSATVDLYAMTDILQYTSVAIARIKGYLLQLLSATDDDSITVPVATSVTVTNFGPQLPTPLDFASNGASLALACTAVAGAVTAATINAAGSGYPPSATFMVTPVQSGSSGAVVAVTTNSSGVPTSVTVVAGGSGYTSATLPTVQLGQYTLYSGGVHDYFDTTAAGFCLVSSTARNFRIYNNDASNTATFQLTAFAGTT